MPTALLVVLATQVIYSGSDFMGRYYMTKYGFHGATFLSPWFLWYQAIRQVAMFGQLYVFAYVPLGKTMALMGASSIIISNVLGLLFLREMLSPLAYGGVVLAVIAILILAFR
jgi:multidrug transporter EmrE-like cation transporter